MQNTNSILICILLILIACTQNIKQDDDNSCNSQKDSREKNVVKEKFSDIENDKNTCDDEHYNDKIALFETQHSEHNDTEHIDSIVFSGSDLCNVYIHNVQQHIQQEPIFSNFVNDDLLGHIGSIEISYACDYFEKHDKEKQDNIIQAIQEGTYCCPYWLFPRKISLFTKNPFNAQRLVSSFLSTDRIDENENIDIAWFELYKSGLFVFSKEETAYVYSINTCKPNVFSQCKKAITLMNPDIAFGIPCGGAKRIWIKK